MTHLESSKQKYPRGFTIIGTGRVGSALAQQLYQKGYIIRSLFNRTRTNCEKIAGLTETRSTGIFPKSGDELGDLVFLSLPDDQIVDYVQQVKEKLPDPGRSAWVHTSGGTPTGILQPLADSGAAVASFHPVQTFNGKNHETAFERTYVTLNGNEGLCNDLKQIVRELGGRPLVVDNHQKMAIHLAAVFVCNYYAPLFAASRQILRDNGVEVRSSDLFEPIVRQSVEGLLYNSPADVLTGPVVRGDAGTIKQHLGVLKKSPQWERIYRELGMVTLQLAREKVDRDGSGDDILKDLLRTD